MDLPPVDSSCLPLYFFPDRPEIRTAGSAGGLFCPYKGLLPATSQDVLQDVLNEFANRTFFTH